MPNPRSSPRTTFKPQVVVPAYFGFRCNLPLTLRSGPFPVLRERINGWIDHTVDTFALIGTVAGIRTTLAYGLWRGLAVNRAHCQDERDVSLAADTRTHLLSRAPGHATEAE